MKGLAEISLTGMAWAVAAGAGIPIMATLNGAVAKSTGSPAMAVALLFAIGLVASLAVLVTSGLDVVLSRFQGLPAFWFAGGLIVAFYIHSVTALVPRYGVANVILFVMVAQLAMSALIDHFGLFGMPRTPVHPTRFAGLIAIVAGLALTQSGTQSR